MKLDNVPIIFITHYFNIWLEALCFQENKNTQLAVHLLQFNRSIFGCIWFVLFLQARCETIGCLVGAQLGLASSVPRSDDLCRSRDQECGT